MKTCPNKKIHGFTLIELMVAMAITTIIVTILISITSVSLDTWNRSRAEIRAARQAQAMTEIMARDFEAMVARSGNNFEWFVASAQTGVGSGTSESPNSADLIFFTAATDRYQGEIGSDSDLGGDVSAVGYSLRYKDPIGDSDLETFVLYRKLVNPDVTFNNLLGLQKKETLPSESALKTAFDAAAGDVGSIAGDTMNMDHMANFVCENVHQFSVTFHIEYDHSEDGSFVGAPPIISRRTKPVTLTSGDITEIRLTGSGLQILPRDEDIEKSGQITAIELSITVLSDNAMNSIRSGANVPPAFIRQNSFQYSKRVDIPRM